VAYRFSNTSDLPITGMAFLKNDSYLIKGASDYSIEVMSLRRRSRGVFVLFGLIWIAVAALFVWSALYEGKKGLAGRLVEL